MIGFLWNFSLICIIIVVIFQLQMSQSFYRKCIKKVMSISQIETIIIFLHKCNSYYRIERVIISLVFFLLVMSEI